MLPLEKSILETIVYFSFFDYPLRVNEIQRWLWKNGAEIEDVNSTLRDSEFLKEKLSSKDGFFFLTPPNSPPISSPTCPPKPELSADSAFVAEATSAKEAALAKVGGRRWKAKQGGQGGAPSLVLKGSEGLTETRLKRYRFAEKKIKKAKDIVWLLSKFPGILGIAVCNDLGYGNSPEKGDIDLFVITKKNRVWTARFWVALFLKIFRLRPGEAKENAICPSFFVDEDCLNLKNLAAANPPEDDIHFVCWINQMTPICGDESLWRKFYDENKWTENSLPNRRFFLTNPVRNVISNGASPVRKIGMSFKFPSFTGNWFENFLRLKFLSPKIKEAMNKSNDVIIREGVLKFHTNDRRKFYFDEFRKRISLMGSSDSPHELH